jgi:hypothetical protein
MENNYTTNLTTEERARKLKMPVETSMSYLENNWDKVIPYGDLLIVAGYAGEMSGNNVFVAVYQVLDYETVVMEKISPQLFEDEGHAIRWAFENIYR